MRGPCALAGITFAAAAALAAGAATAQVPYQIGNDRGSVTVDMGVLESLGPMPTVPQMLRPGTPVGETGYDPRKGSLAAVDPSRGGAYAGRAAPGGAAGAPQLGVDDSPAPDWLRRPDAPRYAPMPETLGRSPAGAPGRGASGLAAPKLTPPATTSAPPPGTSAPTLRPPEPKPPQTAAPASARVEQKTTAAAPPPRPAVPPAAPPPKPAAPARATPPAPPPPAARAPEPPRAPPPPALPAATPPAPAKEVQVAAASPGSAAPARSASASSQGAPGDVVRVAFDPNQSALPGAAGASLDPLVARLRRDESLRVQLLAYADGDEDNANKARRLSLSRALAVRAYLIDKQIQSTRMDVRALGNRTKESPKDRVDVVLVSR